MRRPTRTLSEERPHGPLPWRERGAYEFNARRVARFCLLALVYYGLLVAPWPKLRHAYRAVYMAAARSLYGQWSPEARTEYTPLAAGQGSHEHDMLVTLRKRGVKTNGHVEISSVRMGYLPTAELIALILATPLSARRRLWALLWGLILVNAFVMGRIAVLLVYYFSRPWEVQLYDPGPFWGSVVAGAHDIFFRAPTCSVIGPLLIWILVALRRPGAASNTILSRAPS